MKIPTEVLMLSSALYRLSRDTISLETRGDRRELVRVPEGAVIEVLKVRPGPDGSPMAQVLWLGKTLEMFAEDVERRGEAILAQGTAK
jgi:hypothetical protein